MDATEDSGLFLQSKYKIQMFIVIQFIIQTNNKYDNNTELNDIGVTDTMVYI